MCTTALDIGLPRKWIYIMLWCVCARLSMCFTAVCVSCAVIFEIVAAHWYFRCTLPGFDLLFGLRTSFLVKPEWTGVKGPNFELQTSNFDLRNNRMDWALCLKIHLFYFSCGNKFLVENKSNKYVLYRIRQKSFLHYFLVTCPFTNHFL